MASISIPDPVVAGLKSLATLSDEQFQELYSAFEAIPLRIRQRSIFDDSEIASKTIPDADFSSIKAAVFPLFISIATVPVPLFEYSKDIAKSVSEHEAPLSDDLLNQLSERLNRLFGISSVQVVAKAFDVLTEHGCTFSSARVLTDVRPVFGEDAEAPPRSAVIVHMLNIDHGERKNFAVALDNRDIQQLIDVLERAKKKTESLKSVIASTGITYIDVV
ncbi:MAG TPA: hypothetical protein VGN86_00225 [Pyrinomonadaceae bacterium]|jgi:hypothetical protein|nr:hypothetical protein [Pyrinomonadaceae bacterium]